MARKTVMNEVVAKCAVRTVLSGPAFVKDYVKQTNTCTVSYDLIRWFSVSRSRIIDDDKHINQCIKGVRENEAVLTAQILLERKNSITEEPNGVDQQVRVSTQRSSYGRGRSTTTRTRCDSCDSTNCTARNTNVSMYCVGPLNS